ncbi:MAG: hypothetical protein AAFY24_02015 [Pseudomonadota bacterium]
MAYSDFKTQQWLNRCTERANRSEELADAFKCGQRFEAYAQVFYANGDECLVHGFLDHFVDEMGLDMCDDEIEQNFIEGSDTASQIWGLS